MCVCGGGEGVEGGCGWWGRASEVGILGSRALGVGWVPGQRARYGGL